MTLCALKWGDIIAELFQFMRPRLSMTIWAVKQADTVATLSQIKRPRLSEAIPTLKRENHAMPKPISIYKNPVHE